MHRHEQTIPSGLTPRQLRIEIAKHWTGPLYQLASAVPVHPITLSAVLNGRLPLKPRLACRILEVLHGNGGAHGR